MTERTEVRFKAYSKSSGLLGANVKLPYNIIDFNVGGGTYSTTDYTYTIPIAGTYLIGASHIRGSNQGTAQTKLEVNRGGTIISINLTQNGEGGTGGSGRKEMTLLHSTMFPFEVNDIIYVYCPYSYTRVAINKTAYTTDDIKNAFWGIRLDY